MAARWNLAAWLAVFLPGAVFGAAVWSCALLVFRQLGVVPGWLAPTALGLLLATAAAAYLRARGRFFTVTDALVRLDVVLGFHNRLSAAARGIGEFPPPQNATDGFRWQWRRITLLGAAGAALVLLAANIPVSRAHEEFRPKITPTSWAELETWAERLAESEIVEPEVVEALEDKLAGLRDRPEGEWFSHSSLEAGDSLREQTAQSLRALERDLRAAAEGLDALGMAGDQLSGAELEELRDRFGEALSGLELGNMPVNGELLSDLREIDLSKARELSAEQLAAMKERLEQGAGACVACVGAAEMGKGVSELAFGIGDGGIGRGGETAPLARKGQPTDLGGGLPERITNDDLSRALPAEVLGLGQTDHDVQPAAPGAPMTGGTISAIGSGGDTVWRDNLTPAERETLQRFFQ